ncbi:NifB/NifX family molybdenum-iron cluster-binding protein [Ancylomarina sp. 16SWW S1-10-2]|uniref:NifB/NifX family molybdenum-iron cluster-binding protein n=1 Tax=Ancylomarina sp. 16SWW S1-10-2 TaxID=2499681 RepID=UPI0012AE83FE|nr:NifB/NifX family molybdenum-iron cluster-binding protein [Ancylomarina sp. 16SWW S1-10-2]MRT92931.1 dinitrogenase iron-molybdenum cofactor biosynthesis protein [Ancylomarina sp. 16SWW S1-10-2]
MSRTVITSSGNELTSQFHKRFGRTEWFCVFDSETKESSFVKNEFVNTKRSAGKQAAELMYKLKADKVISGDFGPEAKEQLEKRNIQMIIIQDSTNIQSVVDRINI